MVTVLVVDDEVLIRMMIVDAVEDAGFRVLEASNADEAIELLEDHPEIRIVFTDVNMPGTMDGLRLAAAVRGRWPPVEIIVASGKRVVPVGELPPRGIFFSKPYDINRVVETMRLMASRNP